MVRRRGPSRLGLKFLLAAALALAAALGLRALLDGAALPALLRSPGFEAGWYARYGDATEDFQRHVRDRGLTVQAALRDTVWQRQHPQVDLYLEDPAALDTTLLEEYGGQRIDCADGQLYAYPMPAYVYYTGMGRLLSLLASAVCFFAILTPYTVVLIRRITRLARDMQVLAGGDLDHRVVSRGRDELAELGRSIEEMRLAVLDQMARETEAVRANSRLITSLSHDLRTPLTKLIGYLDILRHGCGDEARREEYLQRAADKALQMRALSDEMFRHFQVEPAAVPEPEAAPETVSGPVLLGQLLAEQCFDLTDAGFQAPLPVISGEYRLRLRTDDLRRVFDNLFTNLRKYADPACPIRLTVEEAEDRVAVTLENCVRRGPQDDSRGIGLPTIRALLARSGGRMEIEQRGRRYRTTVWLPKAGSADAP